MNAFLKYWGIEEPVFARSIGPADLFLPHALKQKLARLKLACEQQPMLLAITGDPGTGKSTVLRWLFKNLDTTTHDVLLTSLVRRETGPGWVTPRLAEFMGVRAAGQTLDQLIRATAARLDELAQEKRKLLVAIDAAHLASAPAALEELSAFLNLQAFAGRCLTFALCGNDALLDTLGAAPELASKLALHTALTPLTRDETTAYIEHRLKLAGVSAAFDETAVDLIHLKTRGVMAAVDVAADNCLTEAYQKNLRRIGAEIAKLATASILAAGDGAKPLPPFTGAATLVEDDEEKPMSLARMAAGAPPPIPVIELPSAPPPAPSRETEPKGPPRPQESASIKLASLFKSDAGPKKP